MPTNHECDLFLFTSCSSYQVNKSLKSFAEMRSRNVDGWGIGYYADNKARVVRSKNTALTNGNKLSDEFKLACEIIESPVVLGHLRLTSQGANIVENNHPFKLDFLGYEWLLVHNGTAHNRNLVPHDRRILVDSTNDSPRVFEFLHYRIIEYMSFGYKNSLIEAVRHAFKKLLEEDPEGKFNIIMTNGVLSFALVHWCNFHLFEREREVETL